MKISFVRKKTINPKIPHIYGLPKIHKENIPLRPIISNTGSPPHKLAKYLAKNLSSFLGKISNAHLRHSGDLLNRLKNARNYKVMGSYDVKSLFTNVPTDKALLMLRQEITQHQHSLPINEEAFCDLVEACLSFNIFEYDGGWFEQVFGLNMGSPLSPVLACLYLEFIERNKILPKMKDCLWLRYVDDILIMADSVDFIRNIFQFINSIEPTIKFTFEMENNNTLPFLDVQIIRIRNKLTFDVYRKPTNKEGYIHFLSSHNETTKRGILIGFFLRALRICDPQYIDNEVCRIFTAFSNLSYPYMFISKSFTTAKNIFYNPKTKKNKPIRIRLPEGETKSLAKKLFGSKYQFVQKVTNTIGNVVKKIPGKPPSEACIYSIPCLGCPKTYVGETGKSIDVRIKQHKQKYNQADEQNAMFMHSWNTDHRIDWENAKEIKKCSNSQQRKLLEAKYIQERDTFNLKQNPLQYEIPTLNLL